METLLQDVRYGTRMLLKDPGFTVVAVLTLSLGIGANTAIFSVVNAVLLRPLPYREPGRIVTILHGGQTPASPADFLDWKGQTKSFERIGAAEGWFPNLTGRDKPEQLWGLHLSEGMFKLLGVPPLLGRTFLPEDCLPGREHVVVLGHSLWKRRFGGDNNILGQTLTLDGEKHTVIGIMPPQFQFTPFWITWAEMWAPLPLADRAGDRSGHSLRVFGRLKPGVTEAQAQAEMDTVCKRLAESYPDSPNVQGVKVEPLQEKVVGNVRPALLVMLAAVGFVLLIACANVANLLLGRAAARQKEMAVRAALGASRWRTIRQLLTESLLLSLLGAGLGSLLAYWGVESLTTLLGSIRGTFRFNMPRLHEIGMDGSALGFTLLLALLTGTVFGLAPALQASKSDLNESLKEGGRGSSEGGRRRKLRSALVVAEIAIAMVLLVGAGLMMRSFLRLRAVDPGFNPHNVLTLQVSVAGQPQYVGPAREAFYRGLVERVEALPGVQSASAVNHIPLGGDMWGTGIAIEGSSLLPAERGGAVYRVCYTRYFRTMRIPLLKGRDFTDRDVLGAPGVVIINENLASRRWPNQDPIGKRLTLDDPNHDPSWLTVIGVVKNVKQMEWTGEPDEELYLPFLQSKQWLENPHPWTSYLTLVVRTAVDPLSLAGAVQSLVWSTDKNIAVSEIKSLEQVIAQSTWQERFNLGLMGAFASLALVLAAVGIYGVMSYAVAQRTHEIGIRMALGAQQADIVKLVVAQGMILVLAGIALGLVGAFALTRLLSSLLFGVGATDPITFAVIPILLGTVALLACLMPARRATQVDPLVALRYQ
jgi:predicted permease